MNLASLVTNNGNDPIPIPRRQTHLNLIRPYSRAYERLQERNNSYVPFSSAQSKPTTYQVHSPRPPLSPPAEDQRKWSLPSISSLLEGADASLRTAKRQRLSPPESRTPLLSTDQNVVNGSRSFLPPTPPMRPGSGFYENKLSPSTSASSPDAAISPIRISTGNPTKNLEPYQQKLASLASSTSPTVTELSSPSHDSRSRVSRPPYPSPAPSISSYASPVESSPPAVYYPSPSQPNTFKAPNGVAATVVPSPHSQMISPVTPAWQHHHYFPPSTSPPYPQNHDRYVCGTCHKAFSRPSSLRIHSHSHTGEKPFRCTHVGCGKAFSVRSNMKRHERGCHTGRPVAATLV